MCQTLQKLTQNSQHHSILQHIEVDLGAAAADSEEKTPSLR